MKRISTGASAVILAVAVAVSLAVQSEHWSTRAYGSPRQESESPRETAPGVALCGTEQWFDTTLREFVAGCGSPGFLPASPADVNRDGLPEIFSCPVVMVAAGNKSGFSGSATNEILSRTFVQPTAEGPVSKAIGVMPLDASFGMGLVAQLPDWPDSCYCCTSCCPSGVGIYAQVIGWADCDGDGDLDAVVRVWAVHNWLNPPCTYQNASQIIMDKTMWCKNVGFQSQLFGDLDNSGHVDTGDIAILLLNFD